MAERSTRARRSLRFRITAITTVVVTLATVGGGALFLAVLQTSLRSGVVQAAQSDADAIASRIETADLAALTGDPDRDGRLYQVLDSSGRVVAASANARGLALTADVAGSTTVTVEGSVFVLVSTSTSYTTPSPLPSSTPSSTPSPTRSDEPGDDHGGSPGSGTDDSGSGSSGSGSSGSGSSESGSGDSGSDDSGSGSSDSGSGSSGSGSSGDSGSGSSGSGSGSSGSGSSGSGEHGGSDDAAASSPSIALVSAARPLTAASTDYVVIAGRTTDGIGDSVAAVGRLLLIAVPTLIVFIALITWFTTARALRPVERMRAELDAVTASRLDQRIEHPRTSDEIGRLAVTMNAMLDRLDASQRAQRRFVSDASHELKSPLASLRQYAEVAAAHPERIGADELSEAVLDEGARLERLVQGLLVLARADEHGLVVTRAPLDLDDLVLAEARRMRAMDRVQVDATGVGPARLDADAALLGQVTRNLADNAARHARSTVRFGLAEHDDGVVLVVEDDGDGIAPEQRERVFERFVRLDEARARESGGSGLGLPIVREIVLVHGGSVRVEQSALGGARFVVELPVNAASAYS